MGWEVGRRLKRKEINVYLGLIHVDIWQKLTQYCKAIILQLKINLKKKLKKIVKKIVSPIKIAISIPRSSGTGTEGEWGAVLGKQKPYEKCC